MTIQLTTLATQNADKIKVVSSEQEEARKRAEAEQHRLMWDVYGPRIRQLENERDGEINKVKEQAEAEYQQTRERIIELNKPELQVKRILEFLGLDTESDLAVQDSDIHAYRDNYTEPLGYLFRDDYLEAKLFIVGNGKPKNKYSLVVYGKCLFTEELLKLRYGYGVAGYTHERYQLVAHLRDFPAVSDAKAWLEKNRAKLDLFDGYKVVKQEYLATKADYNLGMFKDFIYLQCACGFFYTTFDHDSYSVHYWDDPTCPRCDASLKKGLE